MTRVPIARRPASLIITVILSLLTTAFYIKLYFGFSAENGYYPRSFTLTWSAIMIGLNTGVATGTVLMLLLRRAGIWLFVAARVAMFAVPFVAGVGDEVLGLFTPILLLDTGIFLPAFSAHAKYFR